MTKNQKIALGCGGAGCLGLIVVVIAGGLILYFSDWNRFYTDRGYEPSVNRNRNYNLNSNSNANDNSSSSTSTPTAASSLSDDDKHKLYQAAGMTGDGELIRRVSIKIGLMNDDNSPTDDFQPFLAGHVEWAIRNRDFISSISTAEKARAYVDANLPD